MTSSGIQPCTVLLRLRTADDVSSDRRTCRTGRRYEGRQGRIHCPSGRESRLPSPCNARVCRGTEECAVEPRPCGSGERNRRRMYLHAPDPFHVRELGRPFGARRGHLPAATCRRAAVHHTSEGSGPPALDECFRTVQRVAIPGLHQEVLGDGDLPGSRIGR